jgi:hypothetical protein
MPEWIKTLIIALVSSFFAVILVEPVKAFIQRRTRRRELRRSLYHEMIRNYSELLGQVTMAHNDPEMKRGIGERFATVFKKFSFELARREPTTYYSLGHEMHWIELRYGDMEHIIEGKFVDEDQHLRSADSTLCLFLANIRDRKLSGRLVFSVSPSWLRKHFRERLPEIPYTDVGPPGFLERARRQFDPVSTKIRNHSGQGESV